MRALGSMLQCVFANFLLTFKEDEPAVVSLVSGIDVAGQTPPEVTNGHRVVIQDPVPANPPEPPTLQGSTSRV